MNSSAISSVVSGGLIWKRVVHLLELIRFSHTVFALPFAVLSAVLAWREVPFSWPQLAGILLCMVCARSAAMAFNRMADCRLDARNPRTSGRHLPAGILSMPMVGGFTLLCIAGFVASTVLFFPNPWPLRLSVPVLLFLLGYSYAKRWTVWCHYWLSAALMLSPLAAWIAITGTLAWTPVWLASVIFFWVGGFDILYATQDAEFDREAQLFSLPARMGVAPALRLACVSHVLTLVCLVIFWKVSHLGPVFLLATLIVGILLMYEHWLVQPGDLSRIHVAFFQINALISIGLLGAAALDLCLFPETRHPAPVKQAVTAFSLREQDRSPDDGPGPFRSNLSGRDWTDIGLAADNRNIRPAWSRWLSPGRAGTHFVSLNATRHIAQRGPCGSEAPGVSLFRSEDHAATFPQNLA